MKRKQVGYSERDLATSPYAKFYNPKIAPLQKQVADALQGGPIAHELLYSVDQAPGIQDEGYEEVENGYTRKPEGDVVTFCLTEMPGVTPEMWDWWFGWHGSDPMRYRLWHPKAHVSVGWEDGREDLQHYIGRTSLVDEYLGPDLKKGAVSFIAPSRMGLDERKLAERGEVAICARITLPKTPLKAGWLLHHVRPVPGGSEMRSRTWVGGSCVSWGDEPGPVGKVTGKVLSQITKPMAPDPAALFVHTAQEMSHLASFLPELYKEFGPASANQ